MNIEANITIQETISNKFIRIEREKIFIDGNLNEQELQCVTIICELFKCLKYGIELKRYYDPTQLLECRIQSDDDDLVLCEWLRSGNLKIHESEVTRRYMHCENLKQAISAHRKFTCVKSLIRQLPPRRKV